MFKLNNTREKPTTGDGSKDTDTWLLEPLAGSYGFWSRIRLLVTGVCVEDIDYYNRLHHCFDIMKPVTTRKNDQIEYGLKSLYATNDIVQRDLNLTNYDWRGGVTPCAKDKPNNTW